MNQQFSYRRVLSPFNVALALSIGRIHSFEEQVVCISLDIFVSAEPFVVIIIIIIFLNFSFVSDC